MNVWTAQSFQPFINSQMPNYGFNMTYYIQRLYYARETCFAENPEVLLSIATSYASTLYRDPSLTNDIQALLNRDAMQSRLLLGTVTDGFTSDLRANMSTWSKDISNSPPSATFDDISNNAKEMIHYNTGIWKNFAEQPIMMGFEPFPSIVNRTLTIISQMTHTTATVNNDYISYTTPVNNVDFLACANEFKLNLTSIRNATLATIANHYANVATVKAQMMSEWPVFERLSFVLSVIEIQIFESLKLECAYQSQRPGCYIGDGSALDCESDNGS